MVYCSGNVGMDPKTNKTVTGGVKENCKSHKQQTGVRNNETF
jgi:hypothetical protein